MKTFKQFITEEDDAFDALGQAANLLADTSPIYREVLSLSTGYDLSVVSIDDFITEVNKTYADVGGGPVGGPDQEEIPILDAVQELNRGMYVRVNTTSNNSLAFCRDKSKVKGHMISVLNFYQKSNGVSLEIKNKLTAFTEKGLSELDALP